MIKNKGFTLVELVVAMSIGLLVTGLAVSLVIIINDFVKAQDNYKSLNNELTTLNENVNEFCENFQSDDCIFSVTENGYLQVDNGGDTFILWFVDGKLINNDEVIQECKYIESITFEISGKIIKCRAIYNTEKEYLIVTTKRV